MFRFKNGGEIPHGVVEQSIGTIPLTKKERDEIAKEERRRMNQKLEAQNERYQSFEAHSVSFLLRIFTAALL